MILKDERGFNLPCFYDNVGTRVQPERNLNRLEAFLQTHREIDDANTHNQLLHDLVEHHWQLDGRRQLMTHKYMGSQQSSREVKPKFIDSTQGEPKNIYKP
jgi:hypothetical protein